MMGWGDLHMTTNRHVKYMMGWGDLHITTNKPVKYMMGRGDLHMIVNVTKWSADDISYIFPTFSTFYINGNVKYVNSNQIVSR